MTDLHTHILPGVDDGAKTPQDSIAMLQEQFSQGVDTVVLTPHYYPEREPLESFLRRRAAAWTELQEAVMALPREELSRLPRLVLGAEVAYVPGLYMMEGLQALCIGKTRNMLLELPFYVWDMQMIHGIYDFLGRAGVTPVLAHIERYFACQSNRLLDEVLSLGFPIQVGVQDLERRFSPTMRLLKQGKAHIIASDCHDLRFRRPVLGPAMACVYKKLGQERAEELIELADQLAGEE